MIKLALNSSTIKKEILKELTSGSAGSLDTYDARIFFVPKDRGALNGGSNNNVWMFDHYDYDRKRSLNHEIGHSMNFSHSASISGSNLGNIKKVSGYGDSTNIMGRTYAQVLGWLQLNYFGWMKENEKRIDTDGNITTINNLVTITPEDLDETIRIEIAALDKVVEERALKAGVPLFDPGASAKNFGRPDDSELISVEHLPTTIQYQVPNNKHDIFITLRRRHDTNALNPDKPKGSKHGVFGNRNWVLTMHVDYKRAGRAQGKHQREPYNSWFRKYIGNGKKELDKYRWSYPYHGIQVRAQDAATDGSSAIVEIRKAS